MTASNILAMPLVAIDVITGTSEDWIDSLKYIVQPEGVTAGADSSLWPQLDLRGIDFEMEIRRAPNDHEVIISASTQEGTLAIGAPPNNGYLLIHVPYAEMKYKFAGDYVGDIRGSSDSGKRVVVQITLTLFEGVTKSP